ncbi:MAG: hemerythrin domain-containing protein [Cyclobacteriaceae bacterium]
MLEHRKIGDLVDENHSLAYVLDSFGIDFFKYQDTVLGNVCDLKQVRLNLVTSSLANQPALSQVDLGLLKNNSVSLVIEYLRHAHHVFIKRRLPFMDKLIKSLKPNDYNFPGLIHDVKLVFPLFFEDFIHHIYEEEDFVFNYINRLSDVVGGGKPASTLYFLLEAHGLKAIAHDHEDADDEMAGIRRITKNYTIGFNSDLKIRVLYKELRQFENELVFHARVENDILFPKALEMEQQVISKIKSTTPYN